MKNLILMLTLLSSVAFAYDQNEQKIEMNRSQVIKATDLKQVSLSLSVKTRNSELPVVVNQSRNQACSHKQTLIMFSGYDTALKMHIRKYQIQITNHLNAKTVCQFAIVTEKNMTLEQAARVTLLF